MSVQDVSTWGDTPQILPTDGNDSFSLFQAWAQLLLNENWSIKAGRQVLSYDDQRILGGLDWAMQGRFHDALLVKYAKNKLALDIGGAFNQEKTANFNTAFTTQGAFSYQKHAILSFASGNRQGRIKYIIFKYWISKIHEQ